MRRSILSIAFVLSVPLIGAWECDLVKSTPCTWKVESRTDTISIACYKTDGTTTGGQDTGTPSNSYPGCQVGQPWPECKEK